MTKQQHQQQIRELAAQLRKLRGHVEPPAPSPTGGSNVIPFRRKKPETNQPDDEVA